MARAAPVRPAPPTLPPDQDRPITATRRRGVGAVLRDAWPPILAGLLLAALWEAAIRLTNTPAYLVPAPTAIVAKAWANLPYFLGEGLYTLGEALAGLLAGSTVAVIAAALMAHFRWLERTLFPLAVALKVTPMVAIAPLLVIWLGFGPWPKIIIAALISFFPILANALTGFRAINPTMLAFLRSLHASRTQIFFKLRLPYALPYLFAALKVTTTLSIIGAVVAEWIGADRGLGAVIMRANSTLDMVTLAAAVLVLAVLGIGLYLIVGALERRLLFWHESVLSMESY